MARLVGFEPTTSASAGLRSIQLSYKRNMVPKERFELSRPYGHYALNVARLPFRHFGFPFLTHHGPLAASRLCLDNVTRFSVFSNRFSLFFAFFLPRTHIIPQKNAHPLSLRSNSYGKMTDRSGVPLFSHASSWSPARRASPA